VQLAYGTGRATRKWSTRFKHPAGFSWNNIPQGLQSAGMQKKACSRFFRD
jgi:hypothetical protein